MNDTRAITTDVESSHLDLALSAWLQKHGKRIEMVDQNTLKGARDYVILSVLLYTDRRAQEVATLQWQHVSMHKGSVRLTFAHAKGEVIMQDDLPTPVTNVLLRWLHKWYGAQPGTHAPDAPLWVSLAHDGSHA